MLSGALKTNGFMNLQTFHERTAKWADDTWEVSDTPSYYWESDKVRSPIFTVFLDALNWIIDYDRRKTMTTFTTEDRINASPPHIVDSGASVKTLADFIEQETRVEMLRQQMQLLLEATKKLEVENAKLKREVEDLMGGRC